MGQKEHHTPEETKEQGQKCLDMQPGRTSVSPHSPRGTEKLQKGLCKNETATICVHL